MSWSRPASAIPVSYTHLLNDPRVLILDEPTDGLDPNQKHQVRQLIEGLARDKIVIISTHILEEVTALCTRAVVIAQGRLLADGTPLELESRSRYHQAVTLVADEALDQAALAALPGVAGVEENAREHSLSVLAPVSYTHLDVYKRQGCGSARAGCGAPCAGCAPGPCPARPARAGESAWRTARGSCARESGC